MGSYLWVTVVDRSLLWMGPGVKGGKAALFARGDHSFAVSNGEKAVLRRGVDVLELEARESAGVKRGFWGGGS